MGILSAQRGTRYLCAFVFLDLRKLNEVNDPDQSQILAIAKDFDSDHLINRSLGLGLTSLLPDVTVEFN
jgi:hypothetical protein